jgi:hypothetical protein
LAIVRLGCLGCLTVALLVAVAGIAVAGLIFFSVNIFDDPGLHGPPFTSADGHRAQQKVYEIIVRQANRSDRITPVVFTEAELNAFLSRHLVETSNLSISPLWVALQSRNMVEIRGRTTLRNLLQRFPFDQIASYLPETADQPVWIQVRGELRLERDRARGRQHGRLRVSNFLLGTQPISPWVFRAILGWTSEGVLRWPVPAVVHDLEVRDGRLVVRTAPR